ncbi:hypothetical protein MSAN_01086700 [Mycena sanguinolenta]|uniref:Uncharacterized protein n=1 Tax=Mycena sanguinolenta TaxID=230812 RepID=A0A8H7D6N3_9AGAR|nr:hypothetical protein MSAN_01086700 [Mycena sanguinolenta]
MGNSPSTTYVSDWVGECASRFNCNSTGLVDILGQPTSCLVNSTIQSSHDVWGVTYEACKAVCGGMVQSVNFSSAVVVLTTWLLPWIALIAQLPFEAGGWMDLLSACLCVGSPALATYSLALTAFNRRYISNQFKQLKERAATDTQQNYRYMVERVEKADVVLKETQQCPMRADQRTGELASLVVLPDRQNFWLIAEKDLKNTGRGFTYSFLAQTILAFMSYMVSLIVAVDSPQGPDVGLQFAASSLWIWMFPIVFGYIRVGSQCKAGAIKEALVDNHIISQRGVPGGGEVRYQKGLRPDANLYPPFDTPTWLGRDVRGDERLEGPIFNYARIFTWFAFADHVRKAFDTSIYCLRTREPNAPVVPQEVIPPADPENMTAQDAASCCGLAPSQNLRAFMSWEDIPSDTIQHIFYAALLALFLQWGTTGAALFVGYYTRPVGLGCRSGSYLIYGVAATISWLLLVLSQFLSHEVMQQLERNPLQRSPHKTWMAVVTRVVGKAIAIANAGWLIALSFIAETGIFKTCLCQSNSFQYHAGAWIVLFKGGGRLGLWLGGFTFSIVVGLLTAVIFNV